MHLLLETPTGMLQRRIPSASPLPDRATYGEAAEVATHNAAAVWGLPDFTFRPKLQRRGGGSRELGDGLLVVGGIGVVVQVKGREAASSDPEKERRWLAKKTGQAVRQGTGTIRSLREGSVRLMNARGREVEVGGCGIRWIVATIIEHPDPPEGFTPELQADGAPCAVVLRRDWEFLFNQLKSARAVAEYFQRVADDPVELGSEPVRYMELAVADAETEPTPPHPSIAGVGEFFSAPVLPLEPVGAENLDGHLMVRSILEDIAVTGLRHTDEVGRLWTLGELDRLPVAQRGFIGDYLRWAIDDVARERQGIRWRLRSIRGGPGRGHLAFGAASRYDEEILSAFSAWVQLRHHELQQVTGEIEDLVTVGVLLTPRRDGLRPWDTTSCTASGDLGLSEDDVALYRSVWGHYRDAVERTAA